MSELDKIQACAANAHKVAMEWDTKSIGPKVDMTANNYEFQKGERKNMEKACEIKRYADREIDCCVSAYDGDISQLEAAKLIIDRQAKQIKFAKAQWEQADEARDRQTDRIDIKDGHLHFKDASIKRLKRHTRMQSRELTRFQELRKTHERKYATVKGQLNDQAEQLKAKDRVLRFTLTAGKQNLGMEIYDMITAELEGGA